ncbi:MAG: hypothetical protein IJD37_01940 [Clostridia bacterium]|nr:hypothetical protein [Clostridia bacterium]
MSEYSVSLYDFLYCYFKKIMTKDGQEPLSDSSLADMCKQYATDVFGLTDHSGFDKVFAVREGQISYVHRHGGGLTSYVVTDRKLFDENGGIIEFGDEDYDNYASCEIYAQFYADPGYFMKSHLVKYTFTHGEIAPENFSYEIVESSEYEPYFQMR